MQVRKLWVTLLAVAGVLFSAAPASAHQSPGGCNDNGLQLRIQRDRGIVRVGETVTFTIFASNPNPTNAIACDIDNLTISIQLPGPDGLPVATKTALHAGTLSFAGGAGERRVGAVTTAINVNPGVTDAEALASGAGVLHDAPLNHAASITKTLGTTVVVPGIEVTKTGNPTTGQAPQAVTYTFTVYNRTVPPVPLDNVTVADSLCPGATRPNGPAGGDTNNDNRFDPTEVWTYTCTMTHPAAGTYNNVVTACAELFLEGRNTGKVCDDAPFSVTLTPPPVVVPAAKCTLARANRTTVRARQLNTIRVRVRNVDAGTTVTITLPGGKKVTAKTNASGLATFRVRPTRSGTARIQAADCSEVERLSVKPARRVVSRRPPRVTG